jgi:hypothetical protein
MGAPANRVLPDTRDDTDRQQRLQPPRALGVTRVGVVSLQPLLQGGLVQKAVRPETNVLLEMPVEDGQDAQRLLALPLLSQALVARPGYLFQAEAAAQKMLRDDCNHNAGCPQRRLHGSRGIIAVL